PQAEPEADPDRFVDLAFRHHLLQPLDVAGDPAASAANAAACADRCLADPRWRLSIQTHKILGLP
ncbi:MAG: 7-carboxy-7-deazaguanine synthase, partial [Pseudomonadota bacterium]